MGLIYFTFNPNVRVERSTALRVQTISKLYGLNIGLPYRLENLENSELTNETKTRIDLSKIFVCYSSMKESKTVSLEIEYALEKNKIVVRLFDERAVIVNLLPHTKNLYSQRVSFTEGNFTIHLDEISKFLREQTKEIQKYLNQIDSVLMIYLGMLVLSNYDPEEDHNFNVEHASK